MKRAGLLALLADYYPEDKYELLYKQQIINFVEKNHDCFERSLVAGHITASAWLLNKEKTHALLMHHRKLNAWLQLGGHCDGESDVLAVAIKEAQEESGIKGIVALSKSIFDIDVHWIPANAREAGHYHYDIRFLLGVLSDESIIQNNESKELRWISAHDAQKLPTNNPSVLRMMNKWINNLNII
jgi:8-oxo-dGTP pyrophosphatase MutT (NUDIX family)